MGNQICTLIKCNRSDVNGLAKVLSRFLFQRLESHAEITSLVFPKVMPSTERRKQCYSVLNQVAICIIEYLMEQQHATIHVPWYV